MHALGLIGRDSAWQYVKEWVQTTPLAVSVIDLRRLETLEPMTADWSIDLYRKANPFGPPLITASACTRAVSRDHKGLLAGRDQEYGFQ